MGVRFRDNTLASCVFSFISKEVFFFEGASAVQ